MCATRLGLRVTDKSLKSKKLLAFLVMVASFLFLFVFAALHSTPEVLMALITFVGAPVAGMGSVLVAGQAMIDHVQAKTGGP